MPEHTRRHAVWLGDLQAGDIASVLVRAPYERMVLKDAFEVNAVTWGQADDANQPNQSWTGKFFSS